MSGRADYPYPGDSPIARARRLLLAYRQRLLEVSPHDAAELDELAVRWGETWVIPRAMPWAPGDWLDAAAAADMAGLTPAAIGRLRRRGRLVGRLAAPTGRSGRPGYEYAYEEVVALFNVRLRQTKSDT